MQFTIMNGLLCHKKIGLHNASKLFVEMADLYRNNRDEFEKIVKEAKMEILYYDWRIMRGQNKNRK